MFSMQGSIHCNGSCVYTDISVPTLRANGFPWCPAATFTGATGADYIEFESGNGIVVCRGGAIGAVVGGGVEIKS